MNLGKFKEGPITKFKSMKKHLTFNKIRHILRIEAFIYGISHLYIMQQNIYQYCYIFRYFKKSLLILRLFVLSLIFLNEDKTEVGF